MELTARLLIVDKYVSCGWTTPSCTYNVTLFCLIYPSVNTLPIVVSRVKTRCLVKRLIFSKQPHSWMPGAKSYVPCSEIYQKLDSPQGIKRDKPCKKDVPRNEP